MARRGRLAGLVVCVCVAAAGCTQGGGGAGKPGADDAGQGSTSPAGLLFNVVGEGNPGIYAVLDDGSVLLVSNAPDAVGTTRAYRTWRLTDRAFEQVKDAANVDPAKAQLGRNISVISTPRLLKLIDSPATRATEKQQWVPDRINVVIRRDGYANEPSSTVDWPLDRSLASYHGNGERQAETVCITGADAAEIFPLMAGEEAGEGVAVRDGGELWGVTLMPAYPGYEDPNNPEPCDS